MAITTGEANRAKPARSAASVVLFICANCVREPIPRLDWPIELEQTLLPCTGKLQPEHLLKAFEAGADLVCVVGCERDNCHCLEGSRRAAQRVRYVSGILDEAGVGGERVLMFHLPGTAREDMGLACSADSAQAPSLDAIRDEILAALQSLGPNPLRGPRPAPNRETE